MSKTVEIKVPDIGDFKEVEVIEVLVAPGDTIAAEQSLITVESDKASMEIPSSESGVVKAVRVKVGDKIAEGGVILEVEVEAGARPPRRPLLRRPPRPLRPRPPRRRRRPPPAGRSRSPCRTSVISRKWKSSRCWWRWAIPSPPSRA
ncbi:dihydrolipoamide acetyltransferase [Bordetella trematum]|nr:dihydrolipoamide acetyltransferase [Bordetella trematum]